MRLRWSPSARRALASVRTFLAERDPAAARRVERRILERANFLARWPQAGRPSHVSGTRELSIPDIQYVIIYEVVGEDVLILMLWHSRQSRPR
ncbi:type II toxin-antitoxin system RelE/ParE family toxin [Caulobacter sp. KR2-114]|uniref:type II toxin-antitoxin system RelE/ParE family toxin n=1 Tax=Caulobacter sp. KR2-114 TaxID=3400912 RepID=UPI003C0B6B9D